MILSCYYFFTNIESKNLRNHAEEIIALTQAQIDANLLQTQYTLNDISFMVCRMILNGADINTIRDYIIEVSEYIMSDKRRLSKYTDIYGYFDVYDGTFIASSGLILPSDYAPHIRPWYIRATLAAGEAVFTPLIIDMSSNELVISCVQQIHDNDGNQLAVICLNMSIETIADLVTSTHIGNSGYGILMDENMVMISHPYHDYIGLRLGEIDGCAGIEEDLKNGLSISERKIINYKNEPNMIYVKQLNNGWYTGTLTATKDYYRTINNITAIIILIGAFLACILSFILRNIILENRKAEERTQIMLDAMPLCANFWNRDMKNIDCNKEAFRLFQLSSKQEYFEKFRELSPEYQPDGRLSWEKGVALVKMAFAEGYVRSEWMHKTVSGDLIPCEVIFIRVKHRDDFVVVVYTRDLRELKAATQKIVDEREKSEKTAHWYRSILDAIPFPVSVTDINTNWTFINNRMERFLDIRYEDAVGKPCSNWDVNICNTANCGIECAKRGIKQTHFTHNGFSFQVDIEILKDLLGETAGYIEVMQDVSKLEEMARKQTEEESVSRAKSSFLATMSHEIRTPLNTIIGITDIQMQDKNLPSFYMEAFLKIRNSGDLLLGIINNILDLSKIETGKMELDIDKYLVPALISETTIINRVRINKKPIEFILHVSRGIPLELMGDELRIKQILNNLISNAIKYTEHGKVEFSISCEKPDLEDIRDITLIFTITDTGQGMKAEEVSDLFNEYSRFNMGTNRTTEGTGLGMSITRHLVRLMKGEIYVNSEIGKGSVFTVRLPQKYINSEFIDSEMMEKLESFRLDEIDLSKTQILLYEPMPYGSVLIIDDVETNLYVAEGLLAPYGLKLETASSGFKAIDKIKNGNVYDIIFMDHMMPKMDGVETVKILRGLGYTAPIVALTANAIIGQAEIFLSNGFDGIITKPIDIRQLNSSLNRFIRDKQKPEIIEKARKQKTKNEIKLSNVNKIIPGSQLAEIVTRDIEKSYAVLQTIPLNNDINENDLQAYTINVHSMKSVLANIGETNLCETAKKLEMAGKERNFRVLTAETSSFLNALHSIIEKYKVKNDGNSGNINEISDDLRSYLHENLLHIHNACMDYDKKTIKSKLNELREKAWPKQINSLLNSIIEHLLHSDFDEISSLIKEFEKSGY
ncbi:MAG: response regulator [Treponema sp.]|jgi:signal transduction histidine kinase/CheY-like chemotaxis protein/HPt (histidine-containing phosphotransfer) domain-containing protein|nr:response regulator [Treponema sp.]